MRPALPCLPLALAFAGTGASAAPTPFAGPRVEVMLGYDATELPDEDGPEVMFGLRAGKDYGSGPWRVGFDVDLSRSNADKVVTDLFVPGDRIHVEYGTDLYLGLRVGRRLGDHSFGYGLAGAASTHMAVDYSGDLDTIPTEPGGPEPEKFRRPGRLIGFWTGGGIEFALDGPFFLRSEYRYANFHDGLYRHQALVGIGSRF
ncbi:outer membrane beta-barrel protein [Tsuneonella sp. YG55]|uniref:Outer membrane beta-barrel protein n=1 Tax=Tsuneonella litorea TaxID=2976475 RepID=A0A9X3AK08_9SPHN|nr:outer membrane beta-barrel protein [Tsuneonella litorea]MCT2557734.1 outer membrane beta-barrel protein [Tsuneonella litorea]